MYSFDEKNKVLLSYRKYDIGICSVTGQKKQWNDGCRDGFKCRQHIGGKPYVICMNCEKWEGKWKLKQSVLKA